MGWRELRDGDVAVERPNAGFFERALDVFVKLSLHAFLNTLQKSFLSLRPTRARQKKTQSRCVQ